MGLNNGFYPLGKENRLIVKNYLMGILGCKKMGLEIGFE